VHTAFSRSVAFFALSLLGLLVGCAMDRFTTTPAIELRSALGYYKQLEAMESSYFRANGKFGDLHAILPFASGSGEFRVREACQGGYCFTVTPSSRGYVIRITPHKADGFQDRLLSLYGDETHVIRAHYGRPAADEHNQALSREQIEQYTP
jgi:hypothetical protein